MKELKYIVILSILISCKPQFNSDHGIAYYKDPNLSTPSGKLIDSSRFFLPADLMIDARFIPSRIDTFGLKWYSSNYLCFKEPILYNYYLGYENYRFLWVRSFNNPVLITIKHTNRILISTKILADQPSFMTAIYIPEKGPLIYKRAAIASLTYDLKSLKEEFPDADSIIVPRFDTKIILDKTNNISERQWIRFKELLDSCNFWKLEPTKPTFGLDGADWILEGQSQNKYQFVVRWSPKDSFRKCCEYLIKLSAAKDEEIY
jgi:hypothetical protein